MAWKVVLDQSFQQFLARVATDQTRENYWCELISLSRVRVEAELTSYSVQPSSESSEFISEWGDL